MDPEKTPSEGKVNLIDPLDQSELKIKHLSGAAKAGKSGSKGGAPLAKVSSFLAALDSKVKCTAEIDTTHPRGESIVIKQAGDPRVIAYIARPSAGWGDESAFNFGFQGLLASNLALVLDQLRTHMGVSKRNVFSFLRY